MPRLTSIALATFGLLASTAPAFAQQAEIAAKLNDEGKVFIAEGNYAAASGKFRDAVARVPEPKYFYNLCGSLFAEGKFSDAMTACGAVGQNNPSAELDAKAKKLTERIQTEAKAQNVTLVETGGGGGPTNDPGPNQPPPDPTNPNQPPPYQGQGPGPQYQQAAGRPPSTQGLFTGAGADNRYTWTLGVDLYGGGGQIGQKDYYGTAGFGFRIKGDYLLNEPGRIGSQIWLQYTNFSKGEEQMSLQNGAAALAIVDLGVGLYKDLCVAESLCLRPLVGAQLSMMAPEYDQDFDDNETLFNYTAAGARAEIGAHYAFGSRLEHVIGAALGVNAYTKVFSETSDALFSSSEIGLDKGGVAGYLAVGYTYRFNTPIGSSPFVTLE